MADRSRSLGEREFIVLMSSVMALNAVAIDLALPAFDNIRTAFDLGADSNATARIITTYFLGMAVAQLLWGPVTDRFGRRPVLYVGFALYSLGAVASALAPSLGVLLAARAFWGIGAACVRVVAMAIVRDLHSGDAMARVMAFVMAVFLLVPIVAPAIGAAIVAVAPWRWVFWASLVYCGVVALWVLRLGETLPAERRVPIRLGRLASAFGRILRTPATVGPLIAMIVGMGPFTSFLASSELIVGDIYGRPEQFPAVFAAVGITNGAVSLSNGRLVGLFGMRKVVWVSYIAYVPVTFVTLAIALMNDGRSTFWLFIPALTVTLSFHLVFIPNLNAMAMEPLGDIAGLAAAVLGAVSMAAGAILGSLIDGRIDSTSTVTPMAWGFVAAGVIGLVAVRWTANQHVELAQ
ncbi:MAG: multidrug effflux MFS transporter [Actinomycetia bacterium]|nr:multidrug effflux MFS transporter [Actinomycetes bacterium]MCP4083839.1 multidrug effflux MFS transporter [Actinomycetes bacterium]